MAKIPGVVFLVMGLVMVIASSYINKVQDSNSLSFFIWIGYLFLAYGAAKVLIDFVLSRDKMERKLSERLPEEANKPSIRREYKKKFNNMYGYIGYCPKCGTPMRRINIFCHRCGMRQ